MVGRKLASCPAVDEGTKQIRTGGGGGPGEYNGQGPSPIDHQSANGVGLLDRRDPEISASGW